MKPLEVHIRELKLGESRESPSKEDLNRLHTFTSQFYNTLDIKSSVASNRRNEVNKSLDNT